MTDLNDKKKRQELFHRYMNAETTIEEECLLLEYYMHTEDEITPEEEDLRLFIISTNRYAVDVGLSDEKEAEFDKMMKGKTVGGKSHKILPFVLWPSTMAVALILAMFLIKGTMKETLVSQQYAKKIITKRPSSKQTSIKDRPQQEEKGAESKVAIKEDGASQKTSTWVDDKEMQETEKPNTSVSITTTTVNESDDKRHPLNVTAANYCGGYKGSNHFVSSGNITITTRTSPNTNAARYAIVNTGNGGKMVYSEIQDDSVIYIIDGIRTTKETANQIAPDSIIELRRLRRGTSEAIMETPDGQIYDIILITTNSSETKDQNHSLVPLRNGLLVSDVDNINGICLL